mgnify:CR=1 FL=1
MASEAALSGKYKPYPEYKDSVADWVEAIPTHWEISKLRYMFTFSKGLTITKENLADEGVPCVNYGEVHSKYGFEVDPTIHPLKCVSEDYLKSSPNALLSQGDLVFADTSEDIEGSGNFTQLASKRPVFAGYHTIIARPNDKQCSRFYAYVLDSQELRTQIRHAVKGVKVFSITQAILRGVDIWLPTLEERKKIASFLDHETAKIDTLIDKQQQLITLLKEKRQAVISHAVTKGLNPKAPMRDSGVEWLGEVPAHWEVLCLSRVGKVGQGCSFSHSIQGQEAGELPWFKCMDMNSAGNEEIMNLAANYVDYDLAENIGAPIFPAGTVVFPRVGAALLTNKRRILSRSSVVDDNIYTFSPSKIHSRFAYMFLQLIDMASLCSPGLVPTITFGAINNIRLTMPSLSEQQKIVDYVDSQTIKMEALVQKAEFAISLMRERRTALISAAVTGKVDVRHWQKA